MLFTAQGTRYDTVCGGDSSNGGSKEWEWHRVLIFFPKRACMRIYLSLEISQYLGVRQGRAGGSDSRTEHGKGGKYGKTGKVKQNQNENEKEKKQEILHLYFHTFGVTRGLIRQGVACWNTEEAGFLSD